MAKSKTKTKTKTKTTEPETANVETSAELPSTSSDSEPTFDDVASALREQAEAMAGEGEIAEVIGRKSRGGRKPKKSEAPAPDRIRPEMLQLALHRTGNAIFQRMEGAEPLTDEESADLAKAWKPVLDILLEELNERNSALVGAGLVTSAIVAPRVWDYGAAKQAKKKAAKKAKGED